jgi:hypothetical protein
MGTSRSIWAEVRERYSEPRTLRAGELATPFDARFDEGFLIIRKSNGVERRVDRDELRAAFRAIDSGATADALRIVSGNAPYLASIREDLGIERGDIDDDEGEIEKALLLEAGRRVSQIASGIEVVAEVADSSTDQMADLVSELTSALESERSEKDEAVRETIRLRAAVEQLEAVRDELHARLEELEKSVREPAQAPVRVAPAVDVTGQIVTIARTAVSEIPADSRWRDAAGVAVDLYGRDIGSSVGKCRVIIDEIVQTQWLAVFNAEEIPPFKNFHALAQELNDQPGVDVQRLSLLRTLYRLCNPGVHRLGAVQPRRAALILLAVVDLVGSDSH